MPRCGVARSILRVAWDFSIKWWIASIFLIMLLCSFPFFHSSFFHKKWHANHILFETAVYIERCTSFFRAFSCILYFVAIHVYMCMYIVHYMCTGFIVQGKRYTIQHIQSFFLIQSYPENMCTASEWSGFTFCFPGAADSAVSVSTTTIPVDPDSSSTPPPPASSTPASSPSAPPVAVTTTDQQEITSPSATSGR